MAKNQTTFAAKAEADERRRVRYEMGLDPNKPAPQITPPSQDAQSMVLCAIRYTIGRQSYIVSDGQRWAREWGAKSKHVRDVIRRDLREAAERCERVERYGPLGDQHDEAGWRAVLAELDEMAAKEPAT